MGHTVIIGNGISGVTTARHIRKNSDSEEITIISSETKFFYSRTALMYIYMGHMKYEHTKPYEDGFWKKNRINLVFKYVESVDFKTKTLSFSDKTTLNYDKLVLATGSKTNKFGWKGQDLKGVQGLYNFQDLETMESNTKNIDRAVIVGGGLIGVEMTEMLLSRNIKVTFLVRENRFWGNVLPKEEGELIKHHMENDHHVDLRFNTELMEILADESGRVKGIITKNGEQIDCQFVGLTTGVSPNVDFLKNTELEINRGIIVNRYLETNIQDVYALGDCAEFTEPSPGRRPVEQVWYTGRMMGEALGKTLSGIKTKYTPGIWFNSAKFFDIEYQTYGEVRSELAENQNTFYWESENQKIAFRLVYQKETNELIGINNFGFRLRHEICERWINEKRGVEFVLEHLEDVNFDPELYKNYAFEIISKFNSENNSNLVLKKKSWTRIFSNKTV